MYERFVLNLYKKKSNVLVTETCWAHDPSLPVQLGALLFMRSWSSGKIVGFQPTAVGSIPSGRISCSLEQLKIGWGNGNPSPLHGEAISSILIPFIKPT